MEYKIRKVRSILGPPWWHIHARYRLWRMNRFLKSERRRLSPEARKMLDKMLEDEVDRALGEDVKY